MLPLSVDGNFGLGAAQLMASEREKAYNRRNDQQLAFEDAMSAIGRANLQRKLSGMEQGQAEEAARQDLDAIAAQVAGDGIIARNNALTENAMNVGKSFLPLEVPDISYTPNFPTANYLPQSVFTNDMNNTLRAAERAGMSTGYAPMGEMDKMASDQAFRREERKDTQNFQNQQAMAKYAWEQAALDDAEAPFVNMLENEATNSMELAQALEKRGNGKANDILDSAMTAASLDKMKSSIVALANQGKLTQAEVNRIFKDIANSGPSKAVPLGLAAVGRFLGAKDQSIPKEAIDAQMNALRLELADKSKLQTRLLNDLRPNIRSQVKDRADTAELERLEAKYGGQK